MRIFGRRADDGPVATYAAVLDGRHLWWHVPGHDRLVLRETGSGAEVGVNRDPFPLTGLGPGAYDVLADGRPVRGDALPERAPARTPLTPDSTSRYDVTSDGGPLRVVCRTVAPTAVLDVVEVRDDRVHLRITPPGGVAAGVHLVLLDTDDEVLDLLPVTAHHGHLDALVGVDDLPAGYFGMVRVAVGDASGWARVRRSRTDLVDPNQAVLLPELTDSDRHPDRARLRVRWAPDSLLALRSLDPEAGDPS